MAESDSKAVEYSWAFHSLKKWKSETWVQNLPLEGAILWEAHWHPEEKNSYQRIRPGHGLKIIHIGY